MSSVGTCTSAPHFNVFFVVQTSVYRIEYSSEYVVSHVILWIEQRRISRPLNA